MTAMTLSEYEVQEAAAEIRDVAITTRAKELAAEWLADDPLQFLYYISEDSFSPGDAVLLRGWLVADPDSAASSRLAESASRVLRNYINGYALAKGMRVAESTRGLMDGFDALTARLRG